LSLTAYIKFDARVLKISFSPAVNVLKGGSRDGYFFEGQKILISTFCVCADDFLSLSKALHYPVQCTIINFLFASLKCARINLSQAASGVTESQAASYISIFCVKINDFGSLK
jgi:hypothetical protein